MLTREKDTTDKHGRPIFVLPLTGIQVIECDQSEAERDFYDALFTRSRVQFDQFVAQGKVLHKYANILELLLRLRQCCNRPFLVVMSGGDSQEYADLNKLAKRFLETNPDSATSSLLIEHMLKKLLRVLGVVITQNAQYACSLQMTLCSRHVHTESCAGNAFSSGLCPICRQLLKKNDRITCPSGNPFRIN